MLVHVQGASLKDASHEDAVELRVLDDELLLAEPLEPPWCRYRDGFLKLDGTSARQVARKGCESHVTPQGHYIGIRELQDQVRGSKTSEKHSMSFYCVRIT